MNEINKKAISQNFFLLPLIISLLQFVLVFFSLFNRGFVFSSRIILFNLSIYIFWTFCFIFKIHKIKKINFSISNIILFVLFLLIACYLITRIWGDQYLKITAISDFFNGGSFIDTLYHSSIIGSIKTNGYPSLLQNGTDFLYYHCFAHYLVAGLATVFQVPAFVALNYLYPIVFLPIFSWLVIKVASIAKNTFSNTYELTILDYFFIFAILTGFMTKGFADKSGFFLYSSIYLSESSFISLIFAMLYFCIIDSIKNAKNFEKINKAILIPLFILVLSFSKISTGAIFCAGVCYYYFRKFFAKDKNWMLCIVYAMLFLIYYKLQSKSSTFPNPDVSHSSLFVFHYVKTYTKNLFFSILHYLFMLLPVILLGLLIKFCRQKTISRNHIYLEISIFITFISFLPGLLLKINGGSAFYFCTPAFLFSCFILLGYGGNLCLFNKKLAFICYMMFGLIGLGVMFKESHFLRIAKEVVHDRYEGEFIKKLPYSFFSLFKTSPIREAKSLELFSLVETEIKRNPNRYCLYLEPDYELYQKYKEYKRNFYGVTSSLNLIEPNFCASAWFGIPIINSIYIKDNVFYRGDGEVFGHYNDFAGYSIPPKTCGKRVTRDNAIEFAKKLDKSYIIFIKNDSYDIVKIE